MPQDIEISCISKSDRFNPHERIVSIGGIKRGGIAWKRSQEQAIIDIENGACRYYANVGGHLVWTTITVSSLGHKYLKTTADRDQPNNLLNLRECP
jgi:hypothetical protein